MIPTPAEIQEARERLGLSRLQLARAAGYCVTTVRRVESGERSSPATLRALWATLKRIKTEGLKAVSPPAPSGPQRAPLMRRLAQAEGPRGVMSALGGNPARLHRGRG